MVLFMEELKYMPIDIMSAKDVINELTKVTCRNLHPPAQRGVRHVQYVRDETRYCVLKSKLKDLGICK